jgi:WD40 repeat protein
VATDGSSQRLAFSPDSRRLAYAGADGTIHFWHPLEGKSGPTLAGHTDHLMSLAFSPDGKLLASGGNDRTVRLWDLAAGTEQATFTGHEGKVLSLAFSPDSKLLVSGGQDGLFKVWDLSAEKDAFSRREGGFVTLCRFDSDGQWLTLVAGDRLLRRRGNLLRDPLMWQDRVLLENKDGHLSYAYNRDGSHLVVGHKNLSASLVNVQNGQVLHRIRPLEHPVLGVAFFGPGRVATWGGGNAFQVWENSNGRLLLKLPTGRDNSLALSPEGRYVARGNADGTIHLFRLMPPP